MSAILSQKPSRIAEAARMFVWVTPPWTGGFWVWDPVHCLCLDGLSHPLSQFPFSACIYSEVEGKEHWLWCYTYLGLDLSSLLTSFVTMGKFLSFPELQFLHLENGVIVPTSYYTLNQIQATSMLFKTCVFVLRIPLLWPVLKIFGCL